MKYPEFFDRVETITMQDQLAHFLGTFEEGEVTFSYLDVVKMAGHSCPTVAGAYLMSKEALKLLYPNAMPRRGSIRVTLNGKQTDGVLGVIASVIGNITGAAGEGGFKGLNGNFSRNNLLQFEEGLEGMVEFVRVDTNKKVTMNYNPDLVLPDPKMQPLLGKLMKGDGDNATQEAFGALWQKRVEEILTNHEAYKGLLVSF